MSDNEDLLGDDLGDQSLADYNLGNEEEEQLLADDYDSVGPQNVPTSIGSGYRETLDMGPPDYPSHVMEYNQQPIEYQVMAEAECVVPNISVEVPNAPLPELPTYAPYEPPVFEEHAVPPAIPASPIESPQIVPTDMNAQLINGDLGGPRERFVSERPPGVQRMPQVRDIPDTLDKVVIPRGGFGRGRTSWRNPQFVQRFSHQSHPYRRNNMQRGNFNQQQRPQFPPPQVRASPPRARADFPPEPALRPAPPLEAPPVGPEVSPERPMLPHDMPMYRPAMERPPFPPRFFRPHMEERPQYRPNFEPRFFRPNFPPRQFAPPMREIVPNSSHMPQVTIRQALPMAGPSVEKGLKDGREPEVRMLPVPLPANLPPGGLAGKKVLINPHFKGNFQPPVEGLPAYIPTRIQKSPPLSPTIESKFGPVKDIDDAAERFIAEQRSALARAAVRKYARRSPQRYIENTTIEIENELAHPPRRSNDDDDLLRRQEEFINANRAGLRRRMRSPSPPRRSPSPRRSPERRPRPEAPRHTDEDSEYKRRVREQESLRERVLRAKEVRRRKNAVALHKQLQDKERETQDKEKEALQKPGLEATPPSTPCPPPAPALEPQPSAPDTTRGSPDKPARPDRLDKLDKARPDVKPAKELRERSPLRDDTVEVNSTCENLTPPHALVVKRESSERALTPPLPDKRTDSDDDLDLILGDIDGILSDDDDSGRFKEKTKKPEPPKSKPQVDLRSKLPPKSSSEHKKQQRQKIVFTEDREEGKSKKKEKSPPRRAVVTSSTVTEDAESPVEVKKTKVKSKLDMTVKSRQRITYEKEQAEKAKEEEKKTAFSNRRVILQRKAPKEKSSSVFSRIEVKSDPTKPNPGIFSRAVRTAIGTENTRIVIKKDEPQVQFESDSEIDEDTLLEDSGNIATVANLPHGMTDTRLKTLAGSEVQNLILDKEERSAKITFKTTIAAENFKKKFNNKMVAASRLSVTLR
ncbi:hypothetical protein PYW08_010234 [Mythimna loreyi]|uniref:Uncharacterized protein n=1 Tax=Mythimna loreyi TaxID=667449 RepID=A0ACC2Q8I2_9NEOP|nr:hypothetical protein PYW08_010234 [Mythimna loreyi]